MTSSYGMVYNPETGCSEYAQTGCSLVVDKDKLNLEAAERLADLLEQATHQELVTHFARLIMHRPKGQLGEYTIGHFLEDIARDAKQAGVTSLGAALACDILRQNPVNQWFPLWPEIYAAINAAESAVNKLRKAEYHPTFEEYRPPMSKDLPQKEPELTEELCHAMIALWDKNNAAKLKSEWEAKLAHLQGFSKCV